jgi:hypothetical protein
MKSLKECRSLLNMKFIQGSIFGCDPLWSNGQAEFKPSTQARSDITNWLSRILLNYTSPPPQDSQNPMRECYAPNMIVLFKTIEFLISLGYPKHWFKMYLHDLLNNNLVTCETFPSVVPNVHKPVSFQRQLDLSHVLLELKVLSTLYAPALGLG